MNLEFQNSLDLTGVLGEYFVHTLLDRTFSSLKLFFDSNNVSSKASKVDFEKSLFYEFTKTINWSKEVHLKDFNYSQSIKSVYVELDLYFSLRRYHNLNADIDKLQFSSILNKYSQHLIILGQPGAGKTTSLKHLCYSLLFEERSKYKIPKTPFVVRLRDLNSDLVGSDERFKICIFRYLYIKFGLNIDFEKKFEEDIKRNIIVKSVINVLEELNILLILDGLDEVTDFQMKSVISSELEELTLGLKTARIILTSRHGDFNLNLSNSLIFEVCSLTDEQVHKFAKKRLGDSKKVDDFKNQVLNSTYFDAALRPLTLAYLTLIYERYGRIHDKPKEIYKRILRLLIEDWNNQNSVNRISKYSNFDTDRKLEFLASFAYNLSLKYQTSSFSEQMMSETYKKICLEFELPLTQSKDVISEIENHNGMFIQTYYDTYEFSHKSLQEYLTADYLVRQQLTFDEKNDYVKLPNELAIATALSAKPNKYLKFLIFEIIGTDFSHSNFYQTFLTRIIVEKPDFEYNSELLFLFLFLYKTIKGIDDKHVSTPFKEDKFRTDLKLGDFIISFEDFIFSNQFEDAWSTFLKSYEIIPEGKKIDSHKKKIDGSYNTTYIYFLKKSINSEKSISNTKFISINSNMYERIQKNF